MPVDIVRVRNLGDTSIEGSYGGVGYLIRPNETAMLETECAKKDFGDWDARNASKTEEKYRFRYREYLRVRGLYGVTPGARIPVMNNGQPEFGENGVPKEILADQVWKERVPKVEIELMDGSKVTTILEDPEGDSLPAGDIGSQDTDLVIAQMRADIEKLTSALEQVKSEPVDIPVDSPETAPRPAPKKAKVHAAQTVSSE